MTGLSAATLPEKPEVLWKKSLGHSIEATAAIVDGVVYAATMEGKLYALKLSDGEQIWVWANKDEDSFESSPTVDGDQLYIGDTFGILYAFNCKTGKIAWKYEVDDKIISSPVVMDGTVYVGSYDTMLHAVDAKTGKRKWVFKADGPIHCSPTVVNDKFICVAGCDGILRLIDIETQKSAKSVEIGGNIASTPAFGQNRLSLGTFGRQVMCYDAQTLKHEWTFIPTRKFEYYASPALAPGWVVIGGRDKAVHGLNAKDGDQAWIFRTQGKVDSSAVIADNRVWITGIDGRVYALDLQSGTKKWDYQIGEPMSASPAVVTNHLVVGSKKGTIYCFGKKGAP